MGAVASTKVGTSMNYTFLIILGAFALFVAAPILLVAAVREKRQRNAAALDAAPARRDELRKYVP